MYLLQKFEELRNGEEKTKSCKVSETRLELELGKLIKNLNHASLEIRGNSLQWEEVFNTSTGGKVFLRNVWRWKKVI